MAKVVARQTGMQLRGSCAIIVGLLEKSNGQLAKQKRMHGTFVRWLAHHGIKRSSVDFERAIQSLKTMLSSVWAVCRDDDRNFPHKYKCLETLGDKLAMEKPERPVSQTGTNESSDEESSSSVEVRPAPK
eukprot:5571257-Pyramimonas_sp.AAC.1